MHGVQFSRTTDGPSLQLKWHCQADCCKCYAWITLTVNWCSILLMVCIIRHRLVLCFHCSLQLYKTTEQRNVMITRKKWYRSEMWVCWSVTWVSELVMVEWLNVALMNLSWLTETMSTNTWHLYVGETKSCWTSRPLCATHRWLSVICKRQSTVDISCDRDGAVVWSVLVQHSTGGLWEMDGHSSIANTWRS